MQEFKAPRSGIIFKDENLNTNRSMVVPSVSTFLRFAVLPFRRFAAALALLRFPLSVLPLRPTPRFGNPAFRFAGRAKVPGSGLIILILILTFILILVLILILILILILTLILMMIMIMMMINIQYSFGVLSVKGGSAPRTLRVPASRAALRASGKRNNFLATNGQTKPYYLILSDLVLYYILSSLMRQESASAGMRAEVLRMPDVAEWWRSGARRA